MAAEGFFSTSSENRTATSLKAEIEMLEAGIAKIETLMASHQSQFWSALDHDRVEQLMAELLRMTADLMSAREAVVRLKGELTALRSWRSAHPWWLRMLTDCTAFYAGDSR
jgi:predicted  nucleic acid-binding Zn-ribbon protein